MVFISIDKGKLCIRDPQNKTKRFALTDVDGPAKLLRPYVHAGYPIMSSSSVNHAEEYGAPADYDHDAHIAEITKVIGPNDETLGQWATLALAATHVGQRVPDEIMSKLIEAGFFTKRGTETRKAKAAVKKITARVFAND